MATLGGTVSHGVYRSIIDGLLSRAKDVVGSSNVLRTSSFPSFRSFFDSW